MYGPRQFGTWAGGDVSARDYAHLRIGGRYRVTEEFRDFDGDVHPVGETWTFLGYSFLPYEDGLSLFVSLDGEQEWQIRLQHRPEGQGGMIEHIATFIAPAD